MKRQVWGFVLVVLGVLALLQGTGQFQFGLSFWPVVGTLAGFGILWSSIRKVSWFGIALGLWLGAMGLSTILANAGVMLPGGVDAGVIAKSGWPLLLIAIGVSVFFGRAKASWSWDWSGAGKGGPVGEVRMGRGPWVLDKDLSFDHGVGDIKIDLSTADITPGEHRVEFKAGIGEMVIRVPDNISVEVEATAGIGELTVLGDHRNGFGLKLSKTVAVPESEVLLRIHAKLGIGSLRIVHVPSTPTRLIVE